MERLAVHATTVLGLDWYIALLVLVALVVVGIFALSAAGLWTLGSLGRRGTGTDGRGTASDR